MDEDYDESLQDLPEQAKRFRHQSYNQQLKGVHLPSAFNQKAYDEDIGDNDSHFHESLEHWRQLNLSPGFIEFANKAGPMSLSMPLLLHNWRDIIEIWATAMEGSDDEGLRALLDLLQKMAHDLRTTIAPVYNDILGRLLKLLARSISAEALTVLLETFNTLFRFLLVPSIHPELLGSTWTAIKSTLPRCLPEIQRAMAEVWGSVLRKLKSAAREQAVQLLAASAEDVDDASAWVLVFACKSVSQTLHTSTASIISPLVAYNLKTDSPEPTFNIIRRTLTALIHHVKNADGFSSLGNLIVQQVKTTVKIGDEEQIRRVLEVATIPCSVRQGSRLTDAQKSTLFAELENIPLTQPSLLQFTVAIYTSTEMASWLSHGMKFLQRAWGSEGDDHLRFALQLNGALAELGWGGWKLVALPLVLKNTVKPEVLEKHGQRVLAFLARVKKAKKVSAGEVDLVWRTRVEKCALERLGRVKERLGSDVASELDDILALSSFFSNAITTVLVDLIDSGLTAEPHTSTAWVLGIALSALPRREKKEWAGKVDITKWAKLAVERWASNAEVLEAIVRLSGEVPSRSDKLPFSVAYTHLRDCLLSHSRPLRLAALRLLTSKGLISLPEDSASVSEVLKRCLQGEEAEIDVQGVRERVLRIGRVGQVVGETEGAEVCARWLVAQLKVNLRPLWSPANAAIGNLAGRWGDLVWELVFNELKTVTGEEEEEGENAEVGQHMQEEDVEEDEVNEQERSWRDPSAHKFRVAVGHWIDDEYHSRAFAKSHRVKERFDKVSYEYQLLATLGEVSSLAEKHNRELVPYFLHLAGQTDSASPSTLDTSSADRRSLGKQKLVPWLTLFSKFSNPKALYATQTLRSLYISYLSHPFRPLQRIALDCLLTYKSPYLMSRQDLFKTLLDDTRWRDELTNLNLAEIDVTGGTGGGQKEREEVVQVVVRLLFGLMLEKRGQRGRGAGADRRAAVLSALAGCREEELGLLVDLMLEPLGRDRNAHQGDDDGFAVGEVVGSANGRQVVGYLTLLGDVTRLLGSRLVKFWPALLGTVVDLLCLAQRKIEEEVAGEDIYMDGQDAAEKEDAHEDDGSDEDSSHFSGKTLRSIRQTGLKRLADFFKVPVQFAFEPYLSASFKSVISPRLAAFATENTQSPSAILELLHIWSNEHHRAFYLVQYDDKVLPALWDCLVAQNVKPAVVERIFDAVERIVGYAEIDEVAKREILEPHVELLLTNLATLVERTKGGQAKPSAGSLSLALTTPLGQRHLAILSSLAPFATSANQATTLFGLFLPLLKKPNKQVPEKVKANILIILRDMMALVPDLADPTSALWSKLFNTFSSLLATLRTRKARQSLVDSFARLEDISTDLRLKTWLHFVATHLAQLNAYSTKRMDEPDFDARLAAYSKFNDHSYKEDEGVLVPNAWTPILYQAFGDIQDVDELALRSAAGYTLRRFVERVTAVVKDGMVTGEVGVFEGTFEGVFLTHFLPSLRSTLSSPLRALGPNATSSFAVKADLLTLLSFTVSTAPATLSPTIAALYPLLEGGDEEANFFNNVLHIQVHRRTRALRRLGERCEKGEFKGSSNGSGNAVVREWLLPIATWFIGNGSAFMKTHANANKEDQQHHLTTNEAIHTLGRLAGCLGWSPYYGLVQRYLRLANSNDEWEKIYVRAVVAILENFDFEVVEEAQEDVAMDVDVPAPEPTEGDVALEDGEQDEEQEADTKPLSMAHAHRRRPNILVQLKGKLLPSLLAYLSPPAQKFKEDETPLTVRLPIALAIARLTLRLPGTTAQDRERKQTEMRRLATELSHMMKSRSQEVRDAVRDVLGKIALTVLGLDDKKGLGVDDFDADSYLSVLVDELRTALIRGPQLHVLVTTVNSIVAKVVAGIEGRQQPTADEDEAAADDEDEATSAKVAPPSRRVLLLDEIVPSVTSISSTILFGDVSSNPNANKDAGGAVPTNHNSATFREPRQSINASYSLYAYTAQYSSPSVLPELLRDVKGVMGVTSNVKTMAVVDEVLRRVGGGLERNKGIEKESRQASESDWLINVIWGFVSGNVGFLKERHDWTNPKKKGRKADKSRSQFIVQRNRKVDVESDQYAHNSYRFIVLGLDLLHTALRRGRFPDASPTVYKQLDALLPVLGNTLYSTSTPVLLHAMKCVSLLVTRFPIAKLPGMRRALPVYVNQVLQIIKTSGGGGGNVAGTDGELMKGALRTLSTIVRDGPKQTTTPDGVVLPGVELKEKDLTFLLELVAPDLEDPDKQGVAFALLRAIVSRRFVVPQMYDIMEDQVAPLLVQSQSNTVREQARALLLQFMLDYPQGKGRLQKTLAFLLRNASSYVYESGRTSILELLSAVLTKFQAGLIAEYGEMIFVSLVMVLANDDSSKCREAAALLIATLYTRFSEDGRKNIVRAWLKKWSRAGVDASDGGKRKLAYISLQVWGVVVEAAAKETPGVELLWLGETLEDVSQGLQQSEKHMQALAEDDDDSMEVDGQTSEVEWQLPYYSLSTFGKILSACPSLARMGDGKKNADATVPWSLVTSHLLFPHAWVRMAACRALGQLFNAFPLGSDRTAVQDIITSPAFDLGSSVTVGPLRDVAAKLCEELKSEHLDATLGLQIVKNLVWIGRFWLVENDEDYAPAPVEGGDDEDEEEVEEDAAPQKQGSLGNLPWLFSKLSYQVRGSLIRRKNRHGRTSNWSQQPLAAVRWFAAMTTYMPASRLEKFLTHILSPIYRIIEEDTIKDDQLDELRTTAIELQELIQQKVGGTVFSTTYNAIRQKVLEVRRERKTKRLVMGTLEPAVAAKRKEKKMLLKKESRKRKDRSFADNRGGTKRRKEV